jgi:hypothetical protein
MKRECRVKQRIWNFGLALLLSATAALIPIWAQTPAGPTPEALQKLDSMTDQIRALLEQGDLKGGNANHPNSYLPSQDKRRP